MIIRLNNVAKVKNAEVVIDGVTVLAGYNGTGKSTVCKALYAACSAFRNLNQSAISSRNLSVLNTVADWDFDRHLNDEGMYWETIENKFFAVIKERGIQVEHLTMDILKSILEACGGADEEDVVEELYDSLKKVIDRPLEEYAKFVIERAFYNCFNGQLNTLGADNEANIAIETGKGMAKVSFKSNKLIDGTVKQISMGNPVYLETISYLDIVQRRRRIGTDKFPTEALFKKEDNITLEQYEQLDEARAMCSQIIHEVTRGELISNSDRELTYREEKLSEPVVCGNIASGLKNILTIQKLLDNGYLNINSLLIIDEPEVNLHPEWQVKFAEILVLLYKKLGIKIILNTHSPYFMRAIETKLAEHDVADKGRYYYMNMESEMQYVSMEVTGNTDIVYHTMYKPLEDL